MKTNRWIWSFVILMLLTACGEPSQTVTSTTTAAVSSGIDFPTNFPLILKGQAGALSQVIDILGLSYQIFNFDKAVIGALPGVVGTQTYVGLMSAPLRDPLRQTKQDLLAGTTDITIGALILIRDATLPGQSNSKLPVGVYVVRVRQGLVYFVNQEGKEDVSIKADFRELQRDVLSPQTIITRTDICQSWHKTQVCYALSFWDSLSSDERSNIVEQMHSSVQRLESKGLVKEADINLDGTLPDVAGTTAVKEGTASLLAAPTRSFPSLRDGGSGSFNYTTVGVFNILLPIPTGLSDGSIVPVGDYVAKVRKDGNEWKGLLDNGSQQIEVPVKFAEVRGAKSPPENEPPMVILLDVDLLVCWFGEKCDE